LRPALALEVHREQVRPGGEEEPHDLPPVLGVPHEGGDGGEHPAAGPRVAGGLAGAEEGIGLVDHHRHRPQRLEEVEDLLQIRLGHSCHWLRKFRNFTQGIPMSPAKQVARKVFPVPTGPEMRYPMGRTSIRPFFSAEAAWRNICLAPACPATESRVCIGSMNSSSPWHSAWMISFFFSLRSSGVIFTPRSTASVRMRSR